MAGGKLSKEEAITFLKKTYEKYVEEPELTTRLENIPKLIVKFEGNYDTMIKKLLQKYAKEVAVKPPKMPKKVVEESPEVSEDEAKAKLDTEIVVNEVKAVVTETKKEIIFEAKETMSAAKASTKELQKEIKVAAKVEVEAKKVRMERKLAEEKLEKLQEIKEKTEEKLEKLQEINEKARVKIEVDRQARDELIKKANLIQEEIEKLEIEVGSKDRELLGLETESQKIKRETAEAQLKLKSNLMLREELVLERVALRMNQINWSIIGEVDFDEENDLTKIEGIDEFVEKKLYALEIKSYEQISRMDESNMKIINDALEFPPDRISKQNWVQKAADLMLFDN
ncbi:MAG: hypothetical protein ACKVI6_04600 [Candidatus Poseidoniales archaeon]